ncbi:major facilitator superfamily transporter [Xylariales sp. PMI_506]|nr:major facilitator superfamily transporter [Xylariales sp. PMI_506]
MTADETTPLLANGHQKKTKSVGAAVKAFFGPNNRILLAGFLMAFTLGITQVPILYAFRVMECDVFYTHNPPFEGPGDRCNRREINAGTATQYSILGMTTSFSGVLNLFVCGYFIKLLGSRWAFVSQTSLIGLRVATQVIAVTFGGRTGILIFQITQFIGVVGGPRGYQLVLNTAVGEIVAPRDRTAVFGRLQGSIMLGTAFGFLLGGILGGVFNIRRPFEVAFFLYIASTVYGALFMPTGPSEDGVERKKPARGVGSFFAPLKVIVPHKYVLQDGRVIKNYGLICLALGIFLGVFASGYAPSLLQLYATAEFDWKTTENGWLMFGNSLIRGLFLIIIFPKIIAAGRVWFNRQPDSNETSDDEIPTNPRDFEAAAGQDVPQEPIAPPPELEEEDVGTGFDLLFVRWSLVVDSIVTAIAGFSTQSWQVYLAGFLLPFASGSAPAAKGVMTEMCPPHQRQDAISAITLVESAAMLTTQGVFGLIFAGFSEMGTPSLTFFCNAAFAWVGVTVLFLSRFPPLHSKRIDEDDENNENQRLLS